MTRTQFDREEILGWLDRYRLEEDLSYETLGVHFRDAGIALSARALHTNLTNQVRATDRTLFKIQHFREIVLARRKRKRRRAARLPTLTPAASLS